MSKIIRLRLDTVDDVIDTLERHRKDFKNIILIAIDEKGDIWDQRVAADGYVQPFTVIGALDMVRHDIQTRVIEHGNGPG